MLTRVAYVVYRFDVGGLERCVANLCNHLDRERFQPMVVCLERSGSAAAWLERDDVEVVELHKRAGNDLGVVRRLARVLKDRNVHVVHSHNWGTLVETAAARREVCAEVAPDRHVRRALAVERCEPVGEVAAQPRIPEIGPAARGRGGGRRG